MPKTRTDSHSVGHRPSAESGSVDFRQTHEQQHLSQTLAPEIEHTSSISSERSKISNNYANNNYDKVLLTPQDQYIPTLPKVIITASASVSDASGKKLNYSVGNVIGGNVKMAPITYDEYKEDDVVLDPFFLDVPKINPNNRRVSRRDVTSTTTTTATVTAASVALTITTDNSLKTRNNIGAESAV